MKKLKKRLKPSKQFSENLNVSAPVLDAAPIMESNSSEQTDFKKIVAQSKANIAGSEIKRGRGRPKKNGIPNTGTSQLASETSGGAEPGIHPAPIEPSGFPPGTFKRVWEFGANALASRYDDPGFRLTDDESGMLDAATEPVIGKYFPASGLETRPVFALCFSVAVVFGPKIFSHIAQRKTSSNARETIDRENNSRDGNESLDRPLDALNPFPTLQV